MIEKVILHNYDKHYFYYVVLDEATSALSEQTECQFYSVLRSLRITLLSVGHMSFLRQVSSRFNLSLYELSIIIAIKDKLLLLLGQFGVHVL